ncbi:MAG: ABC transporter substrate-binding protein [Burkholderiales bacterium]
MLKFISMVFGTAAALLSGLSSAPAFAQAGKPLTDITVAADFIILGRHAPWYVAQSKGYYREEGINTKVIASRGTGQVLQLLEGNLAQVGLPDIPGLVLGRAKGSKVKVVSVLYQKSPISVFSLSPGANVSKPEDLVGLEIGTGPETFMLEVIQGFMKQKGLDPKTLKSNNIAPAARIPMLVTRKVPAIHLFNLSEPGIRNVVKDGKVNMFMLADHGLELYSLGIGVTDDYLQKNPELVRGFVRASFRGWQDALRNPEEAAEIQNKAVPTLEKGLIVEELKILRDLVVVPDTQTNGFGYFTERKMKATLDFMMTNVGAGSDPAPRLQDLFATGFLPKVPIKP